MEKKGTIPTSRILDKSPCILSLHPSWPIRALNGGLFISRGIGTHPTRTIDSHELIFVRSGLLGIREERREFTVSTGQSLILQAGREHGGTRPYPPDLQFYWIHFVPAPVRAGVRGGTAIRVPPLTRVARPDRLVELFRWFLDDQESGRLQPIQAGLLLLQMLLEVADTRPVGTTEGTAAIRLAARAAAYLDVHFAEPVATAGIAGALSCNPDYLGRVFRKIQGETLTDALHRRRLRHARRLLLEEGLHVAEAARQSGYDDPGYFRRMFRRFEGMTPGAYRRLYSRVHVNTT